MHMYIYIYIYIHIHTSTCANMYTHILNCLYIIHIYIYMRVRGCETPPENIQKQMKTMKTIGGNHRNHRNCKSTDLLLCLLSCMCVLRLMPSHLFLPIIPSRRHYAFVSPMSECNWTLTVYTCLCHK